MGSLKVIGLLQKLKPSLTIYRFDLPGTLMHRAPTVKLHLIALLPK